MVFSSVTFLYYFLPAFLLVYFLSGSFKNFVLLAFSIFFYAWGGPKFVFVILATTTLDFFLVRAMHQASTKKSRRVYLFFSVAINFGLLFYFKYCGFFVENINRLIHAAGYTGEIHFTALLMPIGISFYTFETITYVVDVYRGVHKPLKNFLEYQTYIMMFPKLIAGPIVRYHEIADQLSDRSSNENADNRLNGFFRFALGLAKKVLIANTMAEVANAFYGDPISGAGMANPDTLSSYQAWMAALAYSFQIYFDFSGYSDMALGIGKMLGFRFPENFNHPYLSQSITEFWRRWHITLGNWMKNYLYIPLGGNRVSSKTRLFFNLWLVFLLSGLWHGASWNFVIWGAWHGLFLIFDRLFLEKLLRGTGKVIRVAFTFFIVVLGWVFFRVEDSSLALKFIQAMFSVSGEGGFSFHFSREFYIVFWMAVFFSFFAFFSFSQRYAESVFEGTTQIKLHLLRSGIAIVFLVLSTAYLVSGDFNPFIYFRF
jgi:alginate O-acetyltransferase complex protein AlgI